MELKDRLHLIMETCGWTQRDLVRISKQSQSTVSQWLGNSTKKIKTIRREEAVKAISDESGFSPLWIATGQGPQRLAPETIWPFKRISAEQVAGLSSEMLDRLESVLEAVIAGKTLTGPGISDAESWRAFAQQLAAGVDAVNQDDNFTRFVQAVDQQFSRKGN